jgi:hypothetical protein
LGRGGDLENGRSDEDELSITSTIALLVKEGHRHKDIIDGYSYEYVIILVKAILRNRKLEAVDHAMSTLIAVSHALDMSFNKGKGRIFDSWVEKLLGKKPPLATSSISKSGKKLMSEKFESFLFNEMPRKDS